MNTKNYTISRTAECKANPVMVNGKEIGQVEWTGCFFTRRAGREVRSMGWWFIVGEGKTGRKFKTMKAAAETLYSEKA